MNAVIGAIYENMRNIEIIYEPTHEAFKKDRKNTADSREVTVAGFLESFFPQDYSVKKGKIYNMIKVSNEIDCVLLAPNHPRLITPKREIILAEGVYAAIEVKPDITTLTKKSEFYRALTQIKSVKSLERNLVELTNLQGVNLQYENLIPCGIFSSTSTTLDKVVDSLKKRVSKGDISSHELPDIIVALNRGLIFHSMHIEKTIFAKTSFLKATGKTEGEKYITFTGPKEEILGLFLLLLMCVRPPEYRNYAFILKKYIIAGFRSNDFQAIEP